MSKHKATLEELMAEWKRVEDYWEAMDGKVEYPWTRSRFMLSIFKSMLSQRGWQIPSELGGGAGL